MHAPCCLQDLAVETLKEREVPPILREQVLEYLSLKYPQW